MIRSTTTTLLINRIGHFGLGVLWIEPADFERFNIPVVPRFIIRVPSLVPVWRQDLAKLVKDALFLLFSALGKRLLLFLVGYFIVLIKTKCLKLKSNLLYHVWPGVPLMQAAVAWSKIYRSVLAYDDLSSGCKYGSGILTRTHFFKCFMN